MRPIAECRTLQELFADPSRWSKRRAARRADGEPVELLAPSACCFCLYGGLQRVYKDPRIVRDVMLRLQQKLIDRPPYYRSLVIWNDAPTTKFEDVRRLIEEANV